MRAAIFNPYWDTLGGGERYTISVAKALAEGGYVVDIEWKDDDIKKKLESRFGIDLPGVNVVRDVNRGDGYDVCFWVSDGSVPTLKARVNLLHFQVPFRNVSGRSLMNKMKLFRINKTICNSNFTKRIIDEEFGVESVVVYPPVDTKNIKAKVKTNTILSVGRFSQLKQAKRQDVLISTFKKLYDMGWKDWKLILAGGAEVGADEYLEKLRNMATGYPVHIETGPSFTKIQELLGKAKIFWSAAGFGEREEIHPDKVEHFGIAVVEAMAARAVPFAFNAGGHKETIKDGDNGYLWTTEFELFEKTQNLIKSGKMLEHVAKAAERSSKNFSFERFQNEIISLV